MDSLTKAIAADIRRWPTLNKNRTDVLWHYFCVLGNGMEWQNGRLVSKSIFRDEIKQRSGPKYKSVRAELKDLRKRYKDIGLDYDKAHPDAHDTIRLSVNRYNSIVKFRFENSRLLAKQAWLKESDYKTYPLCNLVKMANVPDNIRPEWLAGVREMILVVWRTPVSAYAGTARARNVSAESEREANIKESDKIWKSLNRRFGRNGQWRSYKHWADSQSKAHAKLKAMLKSKK